MYTRLLVVAAALAVATVAALPALARPTMSKPVVVLSPTPRATISGSTVVLRLATHGFKVTDQGDAIRANEGHFHVYLDKRPFVAVYGLKFVFRGLKPGPHTLRVEPVNSGHMPAAGLKAIIVPFTVAA